MNISLNSNNKKKANIPTINKLFLIMIFIINKAIIVIKILYITPEEAERLFLVINQVKSKY